MQIGDRVKPVESFNFDTYHGPADLEDRGTVVKADDELVWVKWDDGRESSDHATNEGGEDYSFRNFGVVLADES